MNDQPGYKTSEFMLTVLGVVALVALVLADELDGEWAAGAIAFACFGYTAARAAVKRVAVSADAQVARVEGYLEHVAAKELRAEVADAAAAPDKPPRAGRAR